MTGEYISVTVEGTEKLEKIQVSDRTKTTTEGTQARASHSFQEVLGMTEEKQLLDKLVNILHPTDAKEGDATQEKGFKIQKVPENIMLRNKDYFEKHFKPRELSIGPIHAADPNLFKKELKLQLAAHFFEGVTVRDTAVTVEDTVANDMKRLLKGLNRQINELRECYDKKVTMSYSDHELTWLLFLDGCAMLVFIHSYVNQGLKMFNISNGQAALIQQDLFLLENQIPYQVLEELIKFHDGLKLNIDLKQDLLIFIKTSSIIPKKPEKPSVQHQRFSSSTKVQNDHLLDLHRKVLLYESDDPRLYEVCMKLLAIFCCAVCCPLFIFEKFLCCMVDRITKSYEPPQSFNKMLSFRNVQELKAAGIQFKAINSLIPIYFRSRFFSVAGHLFLPTLVVDNSTESILLNLVAYEMSMNKQGDKDILGHSWVTSYVNLLNLLIDNEQDVKDLRAADIIRNCLSNDNEVAQLIERTGSYCFAPAEDAYGAVKENIERHCKRKYAIWVAQVCNTHFSSPWSVVALLAATVVLVLTGIQTWYTVNPKN